MVISNGIPLDSRDGQHRENLRRDGLTPMAGNDDRGAVGRIALAFLAVFGLAVLGSLPPAKEESGRRIERLAVAGSVPAPQIVPNPGPVTGGPGN
jgi:hypothetical protein